FETPFNENLLLSSATGVGGLAQNVFGSTAVAIQPGFRNQFNGGFQQSIGKYLLIDADYFWKFTHNSYDFSTLLHTTITFPIAWLNSKLDGVTGRVSTTNLHGFQAYWTFGHTRARYFPPETGGPISQGSPPARPRRAASFRKGRRWPPAYSGSTTTRHFSRLPFSGTSVPRTQSGSR